MKYVINDITLDKFSPPWQIFSRKKRQIFLWVIFDKPFHESSFQNFNYGIHFWPEAEPTIIISRDKNNIKNSSLSFLKVVHNNNGPLDKWVFHVFVQNFTVTYRRICKIFFWDCIYLLEVLVYSLRTFSLVLEQLLSFSSSCSKTNIKFSLNERYNTKSHNNTIIFFEKKYKKHFKITIDL